MKDERLIDIVEHWDELGWIDRKLIWWTCFKHRHKITGKEIISLAAILSLLAVLVGEHHHHHRTGLLAIIVLIYFYMFFVRFVIYKKV